MRCKVGDLAVIVDDVHPSQRHLGMIVRVLESYLGWAWLVESQGSDAIMIEDGRSLKIFNMADEQLRPIRPGEVEKTEERETALCA